jgi:hypothetical protein
MYFILNQNPQIAYNSAVSVFLHITKGHNFTCHYESLPNCIFRG